MSEGQGGPGLGGVTKKYSLRNDVGTKWRERTGKGTSGLRRFQIEKIPPVKEICVHCGLVSCCCGNN